VVLLRLRIIFSKALLEDAMDHVSDRNLFFEYLFYESKRSQDREIESIQRQLEKALLLYPMPT